jgi:hypothetical protein
MVEAKTQDPLAQRHFGVRTVILLAIEPFRNIPVVPNRLFELDTEFSAKGDQAMGTLSIRKISWQRIGLVVLAAGSLFGLYNAASELGRSVMPQLAALGGSVDTPSLSLQSSIDLAIRSIGALVTLGLLWLARNYLKLGESQKRLDLIPKLAHAAINYAEDIEKRGEREPAFHNLDLPDSMVTNPSAGHQKLALASCWLVDELKRQGIKRMGVEEASKWVAAEFQKSVGDLRASHSVSARTDLAADLLSQLGRDGHITLPSSNLETVSLIQSIADWAATQRGDGKEDRILLRDAAMARIAPRSLIMAGASGRNSSKISPEVRLTLLAKQALEFVGELQKQGKLKMSERETAKAWMIQQVQLDEISATAEQVESALTRALELKTA